MQMRFRVRTRDGRALNPGSLEAFAQLVTDGEVTAYDLVHDELTGEWTPAQLHPVFRMVLSNVVDAAENTLGADGAKAAPPASGAPASPAPSPGIGGPAAVEPVVASERTAATLGEELGLSLAPPMPAPSAEEAKAKFLEELEAEREQDPDRAPLGELSMVDGAQMVTGVADAPVVAAGQGPADRTTDAEPASVPVGRDRAYSYQSADSSAGPAASVPVATPRPAFTSEPTAPRMGGRVMWLLAAVTVLIAVVVSPPLLVNGAGPETESADRPRALRVPDDVEQKTRERAGNAMASRIGPMMRDANVVDIPVGWLDGVYFADAGQFPAVRDSWSRVLELVWMVRTSEEEMYRTAYLAELDAERVSGPLRSMRLSSALPAFGAGRARRMALLRPIEELAVAALALHDLLLDLEGSIRYEPARGPILSRDPVLEAAGTTEEAQAQLEAALDRVTDALFAEGRGPVERVRVRGWIQSELETAMRSVQ